MPDSIGGEVTTLAPLVREITPSVVNISVHGRVKEDNPLYRDRSFREFFDEPHGPEQEVQAVGSGVVVDAQNGYVLTANHVVAKVSTAQVTTKDGRRFSPSSSVGTRALTWPSSACKTLRPSRQFRWATAIGSKLVTSSSLSAIRLGLGDRDLGPCERPRSHWSR